MNIVKSVVSQNALLTKALPSAHRLLWGSLGVEPDRTPYSPDLEPIIQQECMPPLFSSVSIVYTSLIVIPGRGSLPTDHIS